VNTGRPQTAVQRTEARNMHNIGATGLSGDPVFPEEKSATSTKRSGCRLTL